MNSVAFANGLYSTLNDTAAPSVPRNLLGDTSSTLQGMRAVHLVWAHYRPQSQISAVDKMSRRQSREYSPKFLS